MQPPLLQSSSLRLRPSVLCSSATGAAGLTSAVAAAKSATRRWAGLYPDWRAGAPIAGVANNGLARIKPMAIAALNETLILISYRVNGACTPNIFTSAASQSSTIGVCIAIVLLRRPRLRAIYSNVFKRFCGALSSAGGHASLCLVASGIASRSFALSANLPPHHHASYGPPPPPLRGKGGSKASTVATCAYPPSRSGGGGPSGGRWRGRRKASTPDAICS